MNVDEPNQKTESNTSVNVEKDVKTNPKADPKNCQFRSSTCGNFLPRREVLGCVVLKDLTQDVGHLFNADEELRECDLIFMRSPVPINYDGLNCCNHRFSLGIDYKPTQKCKCFLHPKISKAKVSKSPWDTYKIVSELDCTFILGSLMCKQCQQKLHTMRKETAMEVEDSRDETKDKGYYAPVINVEDKLNRREQLDALCDIFGMERVRFQLESSIDTVSTATLNYFCNIFKQFKDKLADVFCHLVAPTQEEQLKMILDEETETQNESDGTLTHLEKAFQSCITRQARLSVLMLVPKEFSKSEVCKRFGCTLYEIKQARATCKLYGPCSIQPKQERTYSRLNLEKAQHFIDFLLITGLLQEVAYGTTNLKLDNGAKIVVSNTILNGIHEHAIIEYVIHCSELNYDPLGQTTLRKNLNRMKPHVRSKLAGVDSFVVEGIEAFEVINLFDKPVQLKVLFCTLFPKTLRQCLHLVEKDDQTRELMTCIDSCERYLKARYRTHCNNDDPCISHCISHALSHPTDNDLSSICNNIHYSVCGECMSLITSISTLKLKVLQLPPSHQKDVACHELIHAQQKIMDWQRHIMRGVQQSKARVNVMKNLDSTSAFWIRDFAQKYLPTKTVESMNEYFGKRGMSISVEVFIFKLAGTYHKQVYLVALDKCDQGSLETLCIADVVLREFKKDFPEILRIALKTDNAANYHANGIPESMYTLAAKIGFILNAYDFNEAQHGKDQCDRETAIFKRCAEKWLLTKETNKITNAKELTDAVFSAGGPQNTKMCVITIDRSKAALENVKNIVNISFYHSVEFTSEGAFYREFYDIGRGKFHKFNGTKFTSGASLVKDWIGSAEQAAPMTLGSRKTNNNFNCPDPLCILQFNSETDMNRHIANDDHEYATAKTGIDAAILYYASQKHIQHASSSRNVNSNLMDVEDDDDSDFSRIYSRGWDRKIRTVQKTTVKQKEFIQKLYTEGAHSKTKLSAEQMSARMKEEMVEGSYYFSPAEYLDVKRIRNIISGLRRKEKIATTSPSTSLPQDNEIINNIEDIVDFILYSDDEEEFFGFDGDEI